jgi:hypothetical protein
VSSLRKRGPIASGVLFCAVETIELLLQARRVWVPAFAGTTGETCNPIAV